MRVLGLHIGHNSTACLFDHDKIVAMASEERFTRLKNQSGFPWHTVEWLINEYNLDADNLDQVAVGGLVTLTDEYSWDIGAWYTLASAAARLLPSRLMTSRRLVKPYLAFRGFRNARLAQAAEKLAPYGIPRAKITMVEHHTCHAHAAYWLDWNRSPEPTLVVTLDNTGDGLSGSVWIARGPQDIQLIQTYQSLQSIGMIYTAITRLLGMKRVEDEYKIMGLAPYAQSQKVEEVFQTLKRHVDLSADSLDIINRTGLTETTAVLQFRKDLAPYRFDVIAAGVQLFVEDLVLRLLKAWARRTGLRKLAVGGGVFMNVKLNMLVNESGAFDEVFFLPSCGDEHNAAGAALKYAWEYNRGRGEEFNPAPIKTLFLGPAVSGDQCRQALDRHDSSLRWALCDDIECQTAELLAQGLVVGRVSGRMEFGARSLGNRSILARADSLNTVRKINAAIKKRDFWMPFAPSVLWERQHDYVINKKETPAPYMILGFRSKPLAEDHLIAGLHSFDLSCRPQLLQEDWNPKYYKLLKHFEELTGFGGLLNTSFNLHGHPVVCTPEDAIDTYVKSDLDVLAIEDYLVWDPQRVQLGVSESVGTEKSLV